MSGTICARVLERIFSYAGTESAHPHGECLSGQNYAVTTERVRGTLPQNVFDIQNLVRHAVEVTPEWLRR